MGAYHHFFLLAKPKHTGVSGGGRLTDDIAKVMAEIEGMEQLQRELGNAGNSCEAITTLIKVKYPAAFSTVDWTGVNEYHSHGWCSGHGHCIRRNSADANEVKVSWYRQDMTQASWRSSESSSLKGLMTWLQANGVEYARIAHGEKIEDVIFDLLESIGGDFFHSNANREW